MQTISACLYSLVLQAQTAEESEEEDFSPSRSRELQFALSSIQVSPTDSVGETPPHFSNPPNITPLNFCRRNIRRFPANYHLPSDPCKVSPSNMKAKFDEQRFSPSYLKANALESGIPYTNGQPHVALCRRQHQEDDHDGPRLAATYGSCVSFPQP